MMNPYKNQAVTNLKKAKGFIDRIAKMIEEEEYCIDICQQVNAALGLLKKTNHYILESHLLTCGTKELASGSEKKRKEFAKEILRVCEVSRRF